MLNSRRFAVAGVIVLTSLAAATFVCAQKATPPDRAAVKKAMESGNWRDAYEGFSKLALDADGDAKAVGDDLTRAVQCLQNLGRSNEIDEFREKVITLHGKN